MYDKGEPSRVYVDENGLYDQSRFTIAKDIEN
jgi:hypothetical protein